MSCKTGIMPSNIPTSKINAVKPYIQESVNPIVIIRRSGIKTDLNINAIIT